MAEPGSAADGGSGSTGGQSDAPSMRLFGSFTREVVHSMQQVSEVAKQGPVVLLLSLGAILMVAAPGLQLTEYMVPNLGRSGALEMSEFIALLVVGAILLLAGSAMRFYQTKRAMDITQSLQRSGLDIMKQSQETMLEASRRGQATAQQLLEREIGTIPPL